MRKILKAIFLEVLYGLVPVLVGFYLAKWEQGNRKAKDRVVDV